MPLVRVARLDAPAIAISVDDTVAEARAGETILVVALRARGRLESNDSGGAPRAGFCLMGACQDCWVWLGDDRRVRACTTLAAAGMRVFTGAPPGFPRDA